jgi:hypothetical protein
VQQRSSHTVENVGSTRVRKRSRSFSGLATLEHRADDHIAATIAADIEYPRNGETKKSSRNSRWNWGRQSPPMQKCSE